MSKRSTMVVAMIGLFAGMGLIGAASAQERCSWRTVVVPVTEVQDLHQEMDLPRIETRCDAAGACVSRTMQIDHFATAPLYEVDFVYRGDTFSYQTTDEPTCQLPRPEGRILKNTSGSG